MARKFKITEEQYNTALSEGITLTADLAAAGGDANKAIENTKQQAQKDGVDISNATIQVPANEGRLITKKQITESRLKKLKENSDLYSVRNFMRNIKY